MKVVQTTEAAADALRATIDQAYGLPARPATMLDGSPLHPSIQRSWDGQGAAPFGWTKSQSDIYRRSAADCWVQVEDADADRVANSPAVSGANKSALAAVLGSRVTIADPTEGGTRVPKASASVAVGAAEAEGKGS